MINPDKTPTKRRVLRQTFVVTVDCPDDLATGSRIADYIKDHIGNLASVAEWGASVTIDEKPFKTPTVEVE